jgi:hypothetical protein
MSYARLGPTDYPTAKGFDKASVVFYTQGFGGYITVRVTEGRLTSALLVLSHPFDVGGDRFAGGAAAPII